MNANRLRSYCLVICFFFIPVFAGVSYASQSQYIYDDIGRLSRVVNQDGSYLFYVYDAVGNLTAINTGVASPNPPALSSINPALLFIGARVPVTITGTNLITTKNLTTNPAMPVEILNISDTQIILDITVPSSSLPGSTVTFTATTLYGSANISATLTSSKLSFSPGQLAIAPGNIGSVTVSILPSVGRNLTITLNNSNPEIASVPRMVTVPSGGITTFDVTGVKDGVTTITSGDSTTVVFVEDPFTTLPGETVTAKAGPVSVYIDTPTTSNTTTSATAPIFSVPLSLLII